MNVDFTKIIMAVIGIGMVTTLILPDRQTPRVIDAAAGGTARLLGTAMGTVR